MIIARHAIILLTYKKGWYNKYETDKFRREK